MTREAPPTRHVLALATAVAAVVTLGACSAQLPPGPVAIVHDGPVDCTSLAAREGFAPAVDQSPTPTTDGPPAGRIPPGFVPAAVVECTVPPGNPATDVLERHLSGDLTTLVAALGQRSTSKPRAGTCIYMLELKPGLFLVDAAGQYVHAAWPLDGCHFILKRAKTALDALHVDSERVIPLAGG